MITDDQDRQFIRQWNGDERWKGIERPYTAENVLRLRGSIRIEYTLADLGARRLWQLLHAGPLTSALGALTGAQAVQQVQAGLKAIYVSGWQVAADNNSIGHTYPDQSLYPVDSVPNLVRRINNAFIRADQIDHMEGREGTYWFAPIVADAEAGFGGILNSYELMKAMIEAGAAAVHLEDQLASAKKCGHLGGKVIIPTSEAIKKLVAARLAADVCGVPTILIGRTDANSATLLANDVDERDRAFITGKRTAEGFFTVKNGIESAISRALAYAPYVDLLWCETSEPDLAEAKRFAEAVHASYPNKLLAYNLSPSFNWSSKLDKSAIAGFQNRLASYGYKFQFVTLAGFHSLNHAMYELARDFSKRGMSAYSEFQDREFESQKVGYKAVKHQSFVGTGYFDALAEMIIGEGFSTNALKDSTEEKQFRTAA
ncbi:MAG TPA: isocitrate lyase [Syntrophobacteraceae bacterium]|nr:isocitrate lyase [Syntrophobacteraceae bacterium]